MKDAGSVLRGGWASNSLSLSDNLVSYNQWGFTLSHSYRRDQLANLERMQHLLDGKPLPDNRSDITTRLYEHIRANQQRV